MRTIENQICEAIEIIAKNEIKNANFDKTISAQIIEQYDLTKGQYKVKYQNSVFFAFSDDLEKEYPLNEMVYVLVPSGDFSKTKKILGLVSGTSLDINSPQSEKEKYEELGPDCILDENKEYNLCSYDSKDVNDQPVYSSKIVYERGGNYNQFTIDEIELSEQLKESTHLLLGATFKTNLPLEQQTGGNYGIKVTLSVLDGQNNLKDIACILNVDKMTGNPYKFITKTKQRTAFELNNYTSISVKRIELFIEKFPGQRIGTPENDILITDLTLQGGRLLDSEELNSYYLSVYAPQGSYFGGGNLAKEITLKANFKIKGKTVSPESYKISFYWFYENPSVTTESKYYCSLGGQGWQCLNTQKTVNLEDEGTLVQWEPAGDTLVINKNQLFTKELKYKCVAVYAESPFERIKTVLNFDANYEIILTSSQGTTFYMDKGITTLECTLKENGIEVPVEECLFDWYSSSPNAGYSIEQLGSENNSYIADISNYTSYVDFKCAVYKNKKYIGYSTIRLLNLLESPPQNYLLTIINGTQIFKYNTEGLSPFTVSQDKMDLSIDREAPALTFSIFDNKTGETITEENFSEKANSVSWYIPKDHTMLSIESGTISPAVVKINSYDYYCVQGTSLKYSINNSFNRYNDNNTIILEVKYNGEILRQETSFLFTKEGDNGTNGTNYVCRIIPAEYPELGSNNEFLDIPFIKNRETLDYGWKYPLTIKNKQHPRWFDIEIWRDGEKIKLPEDTSITWSLLQSEGINANTKNTYYHVTNNEFYLSSFPASATEFKEDVNSYNNITKVEVSFTEEDIQAGEKKEKILYATLPVGAIYNTQNSVNIKLLRNSGFRYVIYQSDGTNPSYNNQEPFEVRMINSKGEDISDQFNYYWDIEGGYTDINGDYINSNDLVLRKKGTIKPKTDKTEENKNELFENQALIVPAQKYNGLSVSNAVVCRVCLRTGDNAQYDEKFLISAIRIPIHSYLNRFGHAAINGWDGNTVQIDNDGGIVLAPQVGAGSKDANNRFTGILMGEAILDKKHKNGLLGFHEGEQSIFLDAETGAATFGKQGGGQIILDPSKEEAIIKSGNYDTSYGREGMAINLSKPSIEYGNRNFIVDEEGHLSCKGASIEGDFSINVGGNSVYFTEDLMSIYFSGGDPEMECYIGPGIFSFREKEPSDPSGQTYGIWWDNTSGPESGLNMHGNFSTSFTEVGYDENTNEAYKTGSGYVYFGTNGGMVISYQNEQDTEDEEKISCNITPITFSFMKEWVEPGEYGLKESHQSGIRFDPDTGLEVIGKITATSGEIGGWLIEEDSISAKNGSMVIHSDGRISGLSSSDGGGNLSGSMFSVGSSFKTGLRDGGLYMYGSSLISNSEYNKRQKKEQQAAEQAEKNGYTAPESQIFEDGNDKYLWGLRGALDVYEYEDYGPGIRLTSRNPSNKKEEDLDTPIYFCVNGKIVMILQSGAEEDEVTTLQDEKQGRLTFPYSVVIYKMNEDGSYATDEDGNKIIESRIQKQGTTIDKNAIYTDDITFLKQDLKTNAQTAVSAINELAAVPKKAKYIKGTGEYDTINETYDVEVIEEQEDGTKKKVKKEQVYEYHMGVKNRDQENEEVTYIERQEIKDELGTVIVKGFKMELEGFFTGE